MKKIFIRAGALLMAVFVFMGAVMVASPVQVSAADTLLPLEDMPAFPTKVDSKTVVYRCCFYSGNGTTFVFSSAVEPTSVIWNGSKLVFDLSGSSSYCAFFLNGGSWSSGGQVLEFSLYNSSSSSILLSQYNGNDLDIYDSDGNLFFPPPPPPDLGPLVEVTQELKDQKVLDQVLMGVIQMIPIGLACLVGYKGLRKALDLLRGILNQA